MTDQVFGQEQTLDGEHRSGRPARDLRQAVTRGFLCKCPNCGEGKLFKAFTKPVDSCAVCGEVISHHRADDLPAYLVITLVGHIVLGAYMMVELMTVWNSWQHLALWVPLTIILSLVLLQPVKGAVIGLQWANYMHGFGDEKDVIESHPEATKA